MPLRRTPFRRKPKPADVPRVQGHPALPRGQYRELVVSIIRRAGDRCENPWCRRRAFLDPAHFPKRSQGGTDDQDHLLALCRWCHDLADNTPHDVAGHLEVEPLGGERFLIRRVFVDQTDDGPSRRYVERVYQRPAA